MSKSEKFYLAAFILAAPSMSVIVANVLTFVFVVLGAYFEWREK